MVRTLAASLLLLLLASPSWSQDRGRGPIPPFEAPHNPATIEPAAVSYSFESHVDLGDRAPDFGLDGSNGRTVKLADLRGSWTLLVFDDARREMGAFKTIDAELAAHGVRLLGVCPDGAGALRGYRERESIPYLLLSDPTGQVSQLFGMYDGSRDAIGSGLVLIDRDGIIRMVLVGRQNSPEDVLQAVEATIEGS